MDTASFGAWVRRRRVTLDLTQAELARRVACAPITIRKIEADERRPSKVMAERLAEALELDDESRPRFVAAARSIVSPARVTTPAASGLFSAGGALPAPPNRLIGRDDEVAEVLDRLAVGSGPARLVTVTGPPGVGKTRFAVEVAERALRKFDVPPVFVDLSVVDDAGAVPARIAATVATPAAALVDVVELAAHALGRVPTLLVLDNLEHVLDAADHVGDLLTRCPDLTVLATSRSPLDLYGEHCFPLGPLTSDHALELLVERAAAVDPALEPLASGPGGAALCAAVDGLPLAVELAARRLRDRSPADLVAALGRDGDPLGTAARGRSPRQHSVTAALTWSYDLLAPCEQALLDRLGIFAATFDRDLVAALVDRGPAGTAPVDPALDELHRQGLVQSERGPSPGPVRYGLLAVVRAFARDHLAATGQLEAARSDHAAVVADRLESVSPGIEAWPEREDVDTLAALEPDALAALGWCFGCGEATHTGRRVLVAMAPLWYFRGQVAELLRWSTEAYGRLADTDPPSDHYRSAYCLAVARWSAGDLPAATAAIREAVAGAQAAGDAAWLAESLGIEQLLALGAGDLAGADALTEHCVAAAEVAGTEWLLLAELRAVTLARLRGDPHAAAGHAERATALAPSSGSFGRAMARAAAADLDVDRGAVEAAVDGYLSAAAAFREIDCEIHTVARLAGVANALVVAGSGPADDAAARICGLVEAWSDHLGAPLHPMAAFPHAMARATLEARLGDERFAALAAAGADAPFDLDTVRDLVATAGLAAP
ncbi:MAG TPA: helix-turn-helix domain-containing protein [Acidimicrobiales bacterium]|nr:helix-turn-helix domain-containing protein [Acidimicrobiales bacterium]